MSRVCYVAGGDRSTGAELALGLADRGWVTGCIPSDAYADVEGVRTVFSAEAERLGSPALVVHALAALPATPDAPLTSLDDATWDAACEGPLRSALFTCVLAREAFGDQPGHLVFVLPVVPLSGHEGQVAFGAALEGIRGLAKSAARRWGAVGITVNCIVTRTAGELSRQPSRSRPVIERDIDTRRDVAAVVELLATSAGSAITGTTIVVDGGMVMVP
jgi:3-oxoacyl-[acyl-carrier protein] reductase